MGEAGFSIVTTQTAKSPNPLRLRLTLKQLFMDWRDVGDGMTLMISADVHVLIHAETASGLPRPNVPVE